MLTIYSRTSSYAAELVRAGFVRAFTAAQVSAVKSDDISVESAVHVFVNPSENDIYLIQQILDSSVKIIFFGVLPNNIANIIGVSVTKVTTELAEAGNCLPAPLHGFSESIARIRYVELPQDLQCFIKDRPLLRYDFAEEWNNLGYGAIRTDNSIWSISCQAEIIDSGVTKNLALVQIKDIVCSSYVTLTSIGSAEILWVNRAVGFIDTQEFRLLETFICNYMPESHPCLPVLREIPYGYDAMVSMRLDCDESIKSSAPLFDLYRKNGIPFSLAIKTRQETNEKDYVLLRDVLSYGGSVLSHTVNHKSNWGIDGEDVRKEARGSKEWIEKHIPEAGSIEYAVSPFHQNPDYAVEALASEGYKGFISGIICNDPQYLISRAGSLYNVGGIVSHSQQCMLHGDCMLESVADPLIVYKLSADVCFKSGAIFGYLDHPFSERYQYGWESESQRLKVHQVWLNYLKKQGDVLFQNEVDTLNYISNRANVSIWLEGNEVNVDNISGVKYRLAYEYQGIIQKLGS